MATLSDWCSAQLAAVLPDAEPIRLREAAQTAVRLCAAEQRSATLDRYLARISARPSAATTARNDMWYGARLEHQLRRAHATDTPDPNNADLGGTLALILALAVAIERDASPANRHAEPHAVLVSLRLSGVRTFLHPATAQISLAELRGRYLLIHLLTQAVAQALLAELRLSALNLLSSTLSRALLLTSHAQRSRLSVLVARYADALGRIDPRLGLEYCDVPLNTADLTGAGFGAALLRVNNDPPDKHAPRLGFVAGQVEQEPPALRAYLEQLTDEIAAASQIILGRSATSTSRSLGDRLVGAHLPRWYRCGSAGPDELALPLDAFVADATESAQPLAARRLEQLVAADTEQPGFGILRMDASRFLATLAERSREHLIEGLSYQSVCEWFFRAHVPTLCQQLNRATEPEQRVLLLHALSDDIVVAGATRRLMQLGETARASYQALVGGVLHYGVGVGKPGMTAADMSRAALAALVASKTAPRT